MSSRNNYFRKVSIFIYLLLTIDKDVLANEEPLQIAPEVLLIFAPPAAAGGARGNA